jgi:hypothetical protein
MEFNAASAKGLLERFDFATLFVNELGWDRHSAALSIEILGTPYALKAIAEKRGMVAWHCEAPKGRSIPDRPTRKKIERQVAKTTLEHLIIFTDANRAEQIWCWARREAGKPASVPEHFWYAASGNRGFLQKLAAIAFSLEEEESLTLVDVTSRARAAFDVERVTKRFYDQFKIEHKAFLDFISGIADVADREWYASLMLNRLMFIYFMQRKGFLNGERDYLRNRLERCQKEKGRDKFYSFYSYFLLRLFHEGLGGKKRNPELEKLLGRIPYLNGGLFEPHPIEEQYPKIAIPDEAFARIFAYFDRYQWHLDERPLRNDNEINPDVLGYIFEKYINQKQMGAYYTKEDITEYISKNTVIPFLFDAAKAKCKVAFENPNGPTIWDHLRDDPDRYIHAAIKHGVERPLPADIATDVDHVTAQANWNRAAPAEFALPTEIWREVLARRTRYAEIRAKLAAGEVREINVRVRNTIHIGSRRGQKRAYTTSTHRWFEEARPHLVQKIQYAEFAPSLWDGLVPKLSLPGLLRALEASKRESPSLERYRSTRPSSQRLYFRKSAYNWVSFSLEPAPSYDANGKRISASDSGEISFDSARTRDLAHTLLNGKIGLLWWAIVGDDFHVTLSNFTTIPFPVEKLATIEDEQIEASRAALEAAMQANLVFKLNAGKRIGNYNLAKCRGTSDKSDLVWRDALCLEEVWNDVELAYAQLVKTDFGESESDEGGDG